MLACWNRPRAVQLGTTPDTVASLTSVQQQQVRGQHPEWVGNMDGARRPFVTRPTGRWWRSTHPAPIRRSRNQPAGGADSNWFGGTGRRAARRVRCRAQTKFRHGLHARRCPANQRRKRHDDRPPGRGQMHLAGRRPRTAAAGPTRIRTRSSNTCANISAGGKQILTRPAPSRGTVSRYGRRGLRTDAGSMPVTLGRKWRSSFGVMWRR